MLFSRKITFFFAISLLLCTSALAEGPREQNAADILNEAESVLEQTKPQAKKHFTAQFGTELVTNDNVGSLNSNVPKPSNFPGRAETGVGNSLNLKYDFLKDKKRTFALTLRGTSLEYFRNSPFDQQTLRGGLLLATPLGKKKGERSWGLRSTLDYGNIWANSRSALQSLNFSTGITLTENAKNATTLSYSFSSRDFGSATGPVNPIRNRDGSVHGIRLAHRWNPAGWKSLGSSSGLSFSLAKNFENTDGGLFDNDATRFGLGIRFPIATVSKKNPKTDSDDRKVIGALTLSVNHTNVNYGNSIQVPLNGFKRSDDSLGFGARADFKLSDTYGLYLDYARTNFDTNTPLASFGRNRALLGLSAAWSR